MRPDWPVPHANAIIDGRTCEETTVPKSRVRKKASSSSAPAVNSAANRKKYGQPWVGPAMATAFLIGVAWLVVYYLGNGKAPIAAIETWNLAIGFGFLIVGFVLSTRWR